MDDDIETTIWSQGVFGLSKCTLESLTQAARDFDFAVLVLSPDDLKQKRGRLSTAPRDNVLFELGLFMGALGRSRTFIVHSRDTALDLPTNLAGATAATFATRADGNLQAALGPVCTQLKLEIQRAVGASLHSSADVEASSEKHVPRRRRRRSLGKACASGPKKDYGIVNISSSGALLETEGEIRVGQMLDLDFSLDDETSARVTARVVRVQQPTWGLVGGVGVAFTGFEGPSREIIKRYVDSDPATHKPHRSAR